MRLMSLAAVLLAACALSAETVPPGDFVPVEAAPDFRFFRGTNGGPGEAVPIGKPYFIGRFPVTCAEYAAYLRSDESARPPAYWKGGTFPEGKARHPVVGVSLDDAKRYARWLGAIHTNWVFRVPTEAEWEHAARTPGEKAYPWGPRAGYSYSPWDNRERTRMNFNACAARAVLAAATAPGSVATNATYVYLGSKLMGTSVAVTNLLSVNARGEVGGWLDRRARSGFRHTDLYREMMAKGGRTVPVDACPNDATYCGCRSMLGNCWEWTTGLIEAVTGLPKGKRAYAVRGGAWDAGLDECSTIHRGEARQASGAGFGNVGFRLVAVPAEAAAPTSEKPEE